MSVLSTVTTKNAADATVTLGTVDAETSVLVGAIAATRLRNRYLLESAFGVTTTPYSAGDVVDAKATLVAVAIRNAGTGAIVNAKLILAQAMPMVAPSFILHIFNADPGTVGSDNAALAITEAAAKTYAGGVILGTGNYFVLASDVQMFDSGPISLEFATAANADDLFGVLEIKTATTFAADEMQLILMFEQDR